MVLDLGSINKHLDLLRQFVGKLLEERKDLTLKELKTSYRRQYLILHLLQMGVQSCLDIGNHIISESSMRRPEEASEVFLILGENKIIPSGLTEAMVRLAKLRNLIVHLYWKIDWEKIYSVLTEELNNFNLFEKHVIKFLQR